MAEVQVSGPKIDLDYTSDEFQIGHADDAGIVNDYDGSAFRLVLPSSGTEALIGSTTQDSVAMVGGYPIFIGEDTFQSVDIPVSSNSAVGRTDLIVCRYSAAWLVGEPGPVRIHRIGGVEGSGKAPSLVNDAYGGTKDLVLFEINRKQGQQPTLVADRRIRVGRHLYVRAAGTLPNAPLGYTATKDGVEWSREIGSDSSPTWVEKSRPPTVLTSTDATQEAGDNWQRQSGCRMERDGSDRDFIGIARRANSDFTSGSNGALGGLRIMRLHPADRPSRVVPAAATIRSRFGQPYHAGVEIDPDGWVYLWSTAPTVHIGPVTGTPGPDDTFRVHAHYTV
ncbi:hypothetical protein [Promicromonospora iranensis]|uniref:Uncharacterized protein n=1 Tax=Promicromonospora iranensis TaxID=1105144 RepID=A0ABU2CVP1_9MICO|nr:hypothetical protein [Promicromonospora iranensis]MDR7385202.1 hypothetical protein [Promicromonospora iranensis]